MAVSQNGWTAVSSSAGLVPLRWVTGRVVGGDVHTILDHLGARFNAEVEAIDKASSWGWAYRAVRGAASLSNHASGTAVDFNAPRHPLGRSGTFTAAQVAAIRLILTALGGVVRWGGDYPGRKDEMHFEINASAAQVSTAAARLRGGASAARPTTPITSEEDDMPTAPEVANAVLNTPDPALGGRTLHEAIASLLRVPGDINTVHQAVLKTPAATAQALLSTRIKRAGLGKGETTLAAVLAWTDDYVMRALNATAQAGGTIDMAQVTAAVKAAADAALGDVKLTLTTKGGAK